MPEYLAPGVFVEEVSYRAKSIEGVSTTTTGFVGPTRFGPAHGDLSVLTSLGEFERSYGDGHPLRYGDQDVPNFMWHAVRAFFDQGGRRLYVKRIFRPDPADAEAGAAHAWLGDGTAPTDANDGIEIRARFPGAAGNGRVQFTLTLGPNVFSRDQHGNIVLNGVRERDVVWVSDVYTPGSPPDSPPVGAAQHPGRYLIAVASNDPATGGWELVDEHGTRRLVLSDLNSHTDPRWRDEVRVLTLAITFTPDSAGALPVTWSGLPLDPAHTTAGAPDSASAIFAEVPPSAALSRTIPIALHVGDHVHTGLHLLDRLTATKAASDWAKAHPTGSPPSPPAGPDIDTDMGVARVAHDPSSTAGDRTVELFLEGGGDGRRPTDGDYLGDDVNPDDKSGLKALEDIEDISIVAAPGSTYGYETDAYRPIAASIVQALIGHAQRMRYRIAIVDSGDGQDLPGVAEMRGTMDSTYAAMYYPWVTVVDPFTTKEINLPPSGFVAGIYARNDINRAVYKAPANEVVTGAIGFEKLLNKAQQEVLNPLGINCFRFFEGRGFRLWGARTISSDPEWKYVNLRRYFAYLEHSIDHGTQWAVFEPNGEALWANVRRTVSDFLFNEFQSGALLGDKPEAAYFVKCDRSTMTQNDLDNGRLVCQIGVAALRPAEFVIFRIGQWTADRKG